MVGMLAVDALLGANGLVRHDCGDGEVTLNEGILL